jgi:hypothetical protein
MYKGVIGKYRFELDSETDRVMVYKEGDGVEPIAYINVKPDISEKGFHYEIMSWVADNGNL